MPKRPKSSPSKRVKSMIGKATNTPTKSRPVKIYKKSKSKNA